MIPEQVRDRGRQFAENLRNDTAWVVSFQPVTAKFSLNPQLLDSENGIGRFEYTIGKEFCNFTGNVHGGIISTLLDDAIGLTAGLLVGTGFRGTTSMSVDFVAPVPQGLVVVAAEITGFTRSMLFGEAKVFVDGKVAARATSVMKYGSTAP